jgi:biopolymer transport protein ExbD
VKRTGIQKRAARRNRNTSAVDLNLVSLIDIFTILIFFLLFNMGVAEILPNSKSIKLPESTAEKLPRETVVVMVSQNDIIVDGRKVAAVADVIKAEGDLIPTLKAELDLLKSRQVIRAENEASTRAITIMGDKEIPYQLLRKVMVTCARADYTDVSSRSEEGLMVAAAFLHTPILAVGLGRGRGRWSGSSSGCRGLPAGRAVMPGCRSGAIAPRSNRCRRASRSCCSIASRPTAVAAEDRLASPKDEAKSKRRSRSRTQGPVVERAGPSSPRRASGRRTPAPPVWGCQ